MLFCPAAGLCTGIGIVGMPACGGSWNAGPVGLTGLCISTAGGGSGGACGCASTPGTGVGTAGGPAVCSASSTIRGVVLLGDGIVTPGSAGQRGAGAGSVVTAGGGGGVGEVSATTLPARGASKPAVVRWVVVAAGACGVRVL